MEILITFGIIMILSAPFIIIVWILNWSHENSLSKCECGGKIDEFRNEKGPGLGSTGYTWKEDTYDRLGSIDRTYTIESFVYEDVRRCRRCGKESRVRSTGERTINSKSYD